MTRTAGIDVGSGAVKAVVMEVEDGRERLLAHAVARIRRRHVPAVVDEVFQAAVEGAGKPHPETFQPHYSHRCGAGGLIGS